MNHFAKIHGARQRGVAAWAIVRRLVADGLPRDEDFVIPTGVQVSVRQFVTRSARRLGSTQSRLP